MIKFIALILFSAQVLSGGDTVKVKSPKEAAIRSAILPGLGQFYNEAYWKIPLIYGIGAYLGYEVSKNQKNYEKYRKLYRETEDYRYLRLRDFYHDQRDLFIAYLFILYIANIVDAYVDAHLYNFDVSEDLSIEILPSGIGFKYRF